MDSESLCSGRRKIFVFRDDVETPEVTLAEPGKRSVTHLETLKEVVKSSLYWERLTLADRRWLLLNAGANLRDVVHPTKFHLGERYYPYESVVREMPEFPPGRTPVLSKRYRASSLEARVMQAHNYDLYVNRQRRQLQQLLEKNENRRLEPWHKLPKDKRLLKAPSLPGVDPVAEALIANIGFKQPGVSRCPVCAKGVIPWEEDLGNVDLEPYINALSKTAYYTRSCPLCQCYVSPLTLTRLLIRRGQTNIWDDDMGQALELETKPKYSSLMTELKLRRSSIRPSRSRILEMKLRRLAQNRVDLKDALQHRRLLLGKGASPQEARKNYVLKLQEEKPFQQFAQPETEQMKQKLKEGYQLLSTQSEADNEYSQALQCSRIFPNLQKSVKSPRSSIRKRSRVPGLSKVVTSRVFASIFAGKAGKMSTRQKTRRWLRPFLQQQPSEKTDEVTSLPSIKEEDPRFLVEARSLQKHKSQQDQARLTGAAEAIAEHLKKFLQIKSETKLDYIRDLEQSDRSLSGSLAPSARSLLSEVESKLLLALRDSSDQPPSFQVPSRRITLSSRSPFGRMSLEEKTLFHGPTHGVATPKDEKISAGHLKVLDAPDIGKVSILDLLELDEIQPLIAPLEQTLLEASQSIDVHVQPGKAQKMTPEERRVESHRGGRPSKSSESVLDKKKASKWFRSATRVLLCDFVLKTTKLQVAKAAPELSAQVENMIHTLDDQLQTSLSELEELPECMNVLVRDVLKESSNLVHRDLHTEREHRKSSLVSRKSSLVSQRSSLVSQRSSLERRESILERRKSSLRALEAERRSQAASETQFPIYIKEDTEEVEDTRDKELIVEEMMEKAIQGYQYPKLRISPPTVPDNNFFREQFFKRMNTVLPKDAENAYRRFSRKRSSAMSFDSEEDFVEALRRKLLEARMHEEAARQEEEDAEKKEEEDEKEDTIEYMMDRKMFRKSVGGWAFPTPTPRSDVRYIGKRKLTFREAGELVMLVKRDRKRKLYNVLQRIHLSPGLQAVSVAKVKESISSARWAKEIVIVPPVAGFSWTEMEDQTVSPTTLTPLEESSDQEPEQPSEAVPKPVVPAPVAPPKRKKMEGVHRHARSARTTTATFSLGAKRYPPKRRPGSLWTVLRRRLREHKKEGKTSLSEMEEESSGAETTLTPSKKAFAIVDTSAGVAPEKYHSSETLTEATDVHRDSQTDAARARESTVSLEEGAVISEPVTAAIPLFPYMVPASAKLWRRRTKRLSLEKDSSKPKLRRTHFPQTFKQQFDPVQEVSMDSREPSGKESSGKESSGKESSSEESSGEEFSSEQSSTSTSAEFEPGYWIPLGSVESSETEKSKSEAEGKAEDEEGEKEEEEEEEEEEMVEGWMKRAQESYPTSCESESSSESDQEELGGTISSATSSKASGRSVCVSLLGTLKRYADQMEQRRERRMFRRAGRCRVLKSHSYPFYKYSRKVGPPLRWSRFLLGTSRKQRLLTKLKRGEGVTLDALIQMVRRFRKALKKTGAVRPRKCWHLEKLEFPYYYMRGEYPPKHSNNQTCAGPLEDTKQKHSGDWQDAAQLCLESTTKAEKTLSLHRGNFQEKPPLEHVLRQDEVSDEESSKSSESSSFPYTPYNSFCTFVASMSAKSLTPSYHTPGSRRSVVSNMSVVSTTDVAPNVSGKEFLAQTEDQRAMKSSRKRLGYLDMTSNSASGRSYAAPENLKTKGYYFNKNKSAQCPTATARSRERPKPMEEVSCVQSRLPKKSTAFSCTKDEQQKQYLPRLRSDDGRSDTGVESGEKSLKDETHLTGLTCLRAKLYNKSNQTDPVRKSTSNMQPSCGLCSFHSPTQEAATNADAHLHHEGGEQNPSRNALTALSTDDQMDEDIQPVHRNSSLFWLYSADIDPSWWKGKDERYIQQEPSPPPPPPRQPCTGSPHLSAQARKMTAPSDVPKSSLPRRLSPPRLFGHSACRSGIGGILPSLSIQGVQCTRACSTGDFSPRNPENDASRKTVQISRGRNDNRSATAASPDRPKDVGRKILERRVSLPVLGQKAQWAERPKVTRPPRRTSPSKLSGSLSKGATLPVGGHLSKGSLLPIGRPASEPARKVSFEKRSCPPLTRTPSKLTLSGRCLSSATAGAGALWLSG